MTKVIVTGATGFLGFHLVKRLKNMGFVVIGLGRNIQKGEKLKELGIEFVSVDLLEKEKLNAILLAFIFLVMFLSGDCCIIN